LTQHLDLDDLLAAAAAALGRPPEVRDIGILEGAVARARASVYGEDAYPDLGDKAAALLHSLARNHPFVDGNKRTALLATLVFYGLNGWEPVAGDAEWISVVLDAAEGQIDVPGIAKAIEEYVQEALLPEE